MGKILVFESDKVQLESIKLLMDSKERKHSFFYALNSADAISIALEQKVDVIICSIDLIETASIEFIDYISFVLPNAVCIYLSDCRNVKHTVACMNRKKPYAIVTKPIANIDEILIHIDGAVEKSLSYKQVFGGEETIDSELEKLTSDLKRMQLLMQYNKTYYEKIYQVLEQLISYNSDFTDRNFELSLSNSLYIDYIKNCFSNYVTYHIMEECSKDISFLLIKKQFNKPDYKCLFDIITLKEISPKTECFKELILTLHLLGSFVSASLVQYDITCHIVELEDAYVIDQKIIQPADGKYLYRVLNTEIIDRFATITRIFLNTFTRVDRFYELESPFNSIVRIEKKEF